MKYYRVLFPLAALLALAPGLEAQLAITASHSDNQSIHLKEGRIDAEGASLEQLLQVAYQMPSGVTLGPSWIHEATYDVHGAAPDGQPVRSLLQQALADRFKLSTRKESRPMDVYVLQSTEGSEAKLGSTGPEEGKDSPAHMRGKGLSAASIANYLSSWLGKPVIDETGLHGHYNVDLIWDADDPQSLIPAIERKYGLRVIKAQRPVEVLVVEHAERF